MNLFLKKFLYLSISLFVVAGLTMPVMGQNINVTFVVNTSTNPDTLKEHHYMQVRGALNGETGAILPGEKNITWDSGSDLIMTNEGGDYWSVTFEMESDDTLLYKFWSGYDAATQTFHNWGWENDLNPTNGLSSNNRAFISGSSDTTVQLQYYNGTGETQDQLWRPYELKTDTTAIFFRVNMAGYIEQALFDPDEVTDTVGVRGGPPLGDTDWENTAVIINRETGSIDSSFWSGVAYIPTDSITIGETQKYKFVFGDVIGKGSVDWETTPDRELVYTDNFVNNLMDTTLHWVYFSDVAPTGEPPIEPVTSIITFRVSTEAVEGLGLFDRGVGDKIYVVGAKGWNIPDDLLEMNFIPALQEWTLAEEFSKVPETEIVYKYFIRWDSSRVDTQSANYIPNLVMRGINDPDEDSGWEEPSVTGGSDRRHVFENVAQQTPTGDFGFDRQFFNAAPANCWFDIPIEITWTVDMRPATSAATNTKDLFTPGVAGFDSVWIQFDGSLFALSQGWRTFGTMAILLQDLDEDTIYTGTYTVDPPGWYQLGFIIAYNHPTTPGTYVTNGGGTAMGRRYYQFIVPDEIQESGGQFPTPIWPISYNLEPIVWVESDLPFEDPPDLTKPTTGIENGIANLPNRFALEQNYPNPFNPITTIKYQLARNSEVSIVVYNVRGQKVATLVNSKQIAGKHTITWNGKNQDGNSVASGIYFIKMKAGDFSQIKKMTLLK